MADTEAHANGNSNDSMRESFMELCRELNMDVESQDTAWASYKKIDQNYVLEVIYRLAECSFCFLSYSESKLSSCK